MNGDKPTWSGIIQSQESGKASEHAVDDDGDQVIAQVPMEWRYEQAW